MFWLSPAAFCDSIADIVQKVWTLYAPPSFFFPLMLPSVIKAGNREQARWAHLSRSDSQSEHKIHPRARG